MRIDKMETLAGGDNADHVVLRQHFSASARRLRASVVMAAGIVLALPIAAIVVDAGGRAQLTEMIFADPIPVAKLAFCGLIAALAFGAGLAELARAGITQRTIAIDPDGVVVEDILRGRATRWREPIIAYRGVRHRVATTQDGARHVLTLEHEDPARTVQIAFAPYISEGHVVQTADRFGLPVLAPVILSQSSLLGRLFAGMAEGREPAATADGLVTRDNMTRKNMARA